MKKVLSIILSLAMLLQIGCCSVGLAEEADAQQTIKVTFTDAEGNTKELEFPGTVMLTEEGTYVIDGDISVEDGTGITNLAGSEISISVTVNGDVEGTSGVILDGKNIVFNMKGDVTATEYNAIVAYDGTKLTLVGDVESDESAVVANGTSEVDITGDVNSVEADAIVAVGDAVVHVDGEVTADQVAVSMTEETTWDETANQAVTVVNSADVTIDGDVTAGHEEVTDEDGIVVESAGGQIAAVTGEGTLTINGDAESKGSGINITDDATLVVNGDVTVENGTAINNESSSGTDQDGNTVTTETDATIVVNGDITSEAGTALIVSGESDATVTGNIKSGNDAVIVTDDATVSVTGEVTSDYGTAIKAFSTNEKEENIANVEVTGNVDGAEYGVDARGTAEVTIEGNLDAGYEGSYTDYNGQEITYQIGTAVAARDESKVTVEGDATSKCRGIEVYDDAEVKITGDLTAEEGNGVYINARDYEKNEETGKYEEVLKEANVEIGGDITSTGTGVNSNGQSTVTVDGDITSGYEETEIGKFGEEITTGFSSGVYAYQESTVEVNGDITSKGDGIDVRNNASVIVDGSVTSELANGISADGIKTTFDGEKEEDVYENPQVTVTGDVSGRYNGIYADGEAEVSVDGSVEGGYLAQGYTGEVDENGEWKTTGLGELYPSGNGIEAVGDVKISVGGDVTAYDDGILAQSNTTREDYTREKSEEENIITITYTRVTDPSKAEISVEGDVTSLYSNGIHATGEAEVTVGGDVTASDEDWTTGINVEGDAKVDVAGDVSGYNGVEIYGQEITEDVTVIQYLDENGSYMDEDSVIESEYSESAAEVNIGGDIQATGSGVIVTGESTVSVGGDVETVDGTAVVAYDTASVTVGGDVESEHGDAIYMTGDATVIVEGDANGGDHEWEYEEVELTEEQKAAQEEEMKKEAAIMELFDDVAQQTYTNGTIEIATDEDGANTGALIVKGTVTSQDESVPLVINVHTEEKETDDYNLPEDMPEIIVHELEANENGEYFDVNMMVYATREDENGEEQGRTLVMEMSEEQEAEMKEAIAEAIQYIINVVNPDNGSITTTGTTYDEARDLNLANEGDEIAVLVAAQDGYKIDGVDAGKGQLIDNGDGTWTVIVNRGGGVTISAVISRKFKPIKKVTGEEIVAEQTKLTFEEIEIPEEGAKINGTLVKAGSRASEALAAATKNLNNTNYASVTVLGINELMTEEENKACKKLNTTEKVMLALTLMGEDQQVEEALSANKRVLRSKAQALRTDLKARLEAMSEAEKAEFTEKMKKAFQTETITVDGKEVEALVLELRIGRSAGTTYQKYYFIEKDGSLVLYKVYSDLV